MVALALLAAVSFAVFTLGWSSGSDEAASTVPGRSDPDGSGGKTGEPERTRSVEASAPQSDAPEEVRGIYLTAESASNIDPFLEMMERTDLNAVVIDVKDVTGEVMYSSDVDLANEIGAVRPVLDLERLVNELEERDIYSIARVATFEDDILPVQRPDLAVMDSATGAQWQNYAGNYWSDAHNREVWEYNVAITKEAAEAGFDEVQFDYVRFPSDGPMERLSYSAEPASGGENTIPEFLEYADKELEPTGARIAADVFGLAAGDGGAGVGQDIRAMAPHLDVINPMVYPSHFPVGSYGLQNPNAHPYEVIENAMADFEKDAEASNPDLEIRPWLQDFDYGTPPYGPAEVKAQIRATHDSGATGWLLWNPSNVYSEQALSSEGSAAGSQYADDEATTE